jgi:hypothetical protein
MTSTMIQSLTADGSSFRERVALLGLFGLREFIGPLDPSVFDVLLIFHLSQ